MLCLIMTKLNKKIILLSISIIFFSILYSLHWLIPYQNLGGDYLPFLRDLDNGWGYGDTYFYYAFIKDIIDGNIIFTDPVNSDYSNIFSIYNSYNLSLVLASISGLFFNNIINLYCFNYFFFPLLNFVLIGIFLKKYFNSYNLIIVIIFFSIFLNPSIYLLNDLINSFSFFLKNNFISTDGADLIMQNNQLFRTPTMLITNTHLFFSIIIIYNFFENQKYKYIIYLILSSSIFFSINNFLIINTIFFLYFITEIKRKNMFFHLLIYILLLFPAFFFILGSIAHIDIIGNILFDREEMNMIENIKSNFTFNILDFFNNYTIKLIILFLSTFILTFKNKKFLQILILSSLFLTSIFHIFLIDEYVFRIWSRGFVILITVIFYIILFKIIENLLARCNSLFLNRLFILTLFLFVITTSAYIFLFEIEKASKNINKNTYFTELSNWLNLNTKKNDVILSLDPLINSNIGSYTHNDTYFTNTYLSRSNFLDRINRTVNILKFYGNDIQFIENFILVQPLRDFKKEEFFYFNLYSHTMNINNIILGNKNYINKIKENINRDNNNRLIFRNNYLIISRFDRKYIRQNSEILKLIRKMSPEYQNEQYTIYELKN